MRKILESFGIKVQAVEKTMRTMAGKGIVREGGIGKHSPTDTAYLLPTYTGKAFSHHYHYYYCCCCSSSSSASCHLPLLLLLLLLLALQIQQRRRGRRREGGREGGKDHVYVWLFGSQSSTTASPECGHQK